MPLIARLALVFASGAVAGAQLADFALLVLVCAVTSVLLFALAHTREAVLLLAAATCGVALGAVHAAQREAGCARVADRTPLALTGILETAPSDLQRTIRLRLDGHAFCGGVLRVRVPDTFPPVRMGDAVRVTGTWMTLRIATDGRPATDGMLIAGTMRRLPDRPADPLLRARGTTQRRLHELFPTAYSLAESLLIAQRENLDPEVRASFAASGLTHLLAISGTHVALVAAVLILAARLLRCSRTTATMVSIAGSTAYVFFLGAPYAALRALIQMALLLASRTLQRPAHPLGLLAGAAAVITFIDPAAPLDPGFQLSFAGICGIVLWRRPLIELQPASLPLPLRDAIATTCAATAITTPIAGFHFGVVSAIALVANLLAIPVVSIAVPATAAVLAVSEFSLDGARLLAPGAELTLIWLYQIAVKCAQVPGAHFPATPAGMAAATITVAIVFRVLRGGTRSTLRGRIAMAGLAGAFTVVAVPLWPGNSGLQIHMMDVGQGDAFAIRSPRGRWLLIDAGPRSERFDAGARTVVPFLVRHHARQLGAVIISHPHLDHFGGVTAVAERLGIGVVLDPGMPVPSAEFAVLLEVAERRGIRWTAVRAGDALIIDGVRLDFIGPDSVPYDAGADANAYSAAVRLSYGAFTALFLGDAPSGVETRLIERYGARMDVDLLKISHHGSGGSSSEALISAASPQVALISAGRRNRYGHPHARVVTELERFGTRVFRTDRDGTVSVHVTANGRMAVRTGN